MTFKYIIKKDKHEHTSIDSKGCFVHEIGTQHSRVEYQGLACCKAGPNSNLGSAPQGGSAH
jgi:hypothetical protein